MNNVAAGIKRGLEQAVGYAEEAADATRYRVHIPAEINVKAIREKLNMTQEVFSSEFGIPIKTLRHWEQKRRVPEGPTRAYLLVIERNPRAVKRALRAA